MLKYSVKLTNYNIEPKKLDWGEKYLDPNLSFVTGVTSSSNHLEKYDKISVTNNIMNSDGVLPIKTENVLRQGYVIVEGKEYNIYKDSLVSYLKEKSGETINYVYTFINGKYYIGYKVTGETTTKNCFTIDDWLSGDTNGNVITTSYTVDYNDTDTIVKLDTLYWIENGKVTIDGNTYDYDFNRNGLTYSIGNEMLNSGETLSASQITKCEKINYVPYDSPSKYQEVTKFKLLKNDDASMPFERITYCKYLYYIKYKNHYCPIKKISSFDENNNESYSFKCEIPIYVLSANTKNDDTIKTESFDLCFTDESGSEPSAITNDNVSLHGVRDIDDLKNTIPLINVNGTILYADVDLQNANDGKRITIYLQNGYENISEGDTLRFRKTDDTFYTPIVHEESGKTFVVFANKKYYVENSLCDKVKINGIEYDIDYVNGKANDVDCLVRINNEDIPFKVSTTNNKLLRYGKIVNITSETELISGTSAATDITYDIVSYSGVTIEGKKYIVRDYSNGYKCAELYGVNREYVFIVDEIRGSSMIVCRPYLSTSEFTQDFIDTLSYEMCNDVVSNQKAFVLYAKNKVFGEKEITKELPFLVTNTPKSTDDYYNLLSKLDIYTSDGYVTVPLKLDNILGGNPLQDDIVERDFFEKEKNNAVNPIVDMEKDVYYPKYIDNGVVESTNENVDESKKYKGSSTTFKPIRQINLNFHFRTRDVGHLGNWKIREGYNDVESSGKTDNWFITDFFPYNEVINKCKPNKSKKSNEESNEDNNGDCLSNLQESSDLLGMLLYVNYDVYYQKQRLAKSFARLSYYDSTDPQTQNLLATSTVFIDEHALFKKYIDNSRKNVNEYIIVEEPKEQKTEQETEQEQGTTEIQDSTEQQQETGQDQESEQQEKPKGQQRENSNSITVFTEFYGAIGDKLFDDSKMTQKMAEDTNRVSSRLVIKNKYETDTSSEGFYIYMFKEYSENLHPKPIYMKIDFYHAGVGKIIPFSIPMDWDDRNKKGTTEIQDSTEQQQETGQDQESEQQEVKISGETTPISALTLDNERLKEGYPLSYVYAQSYIPLYAVYDFKNKEYAYVFDDRYFIEQSRKKIYSDGVVNLNLFEMKIKNEDKRIDNEQKAISNKQQIKAVININTAQFDPQSETCNQI